jgi:hypothetical protein
MLEFVIPFKRARARIVVSVVLCLLFEFICLVLYIGLPCTCWNLSLRHQRRASNRLVGYYGYSDTRAFVTENLPTSYSHVDRIVDYINHVMKGGLCL